MITREGSLFDQVKTFLPLDQSPEERALPGFGVEQILIFSPGDGDVFADGSEDVAAHLALARGCLLHKELQALLAPVHWLCGHDHETPLIPHFEEAPVQRFLKDLRLPVRKVPDGQAEYTHLPGVALK